MKPQVDVLYRGTVYASFSYFQHAASFLRALLNSHADFSMFEPGDAKDFVIVDHRFVGGAPFTAAEILSDAECRA